MSFIKKYIVLTRRITLHKIWVHLFVTRKFYKFYDFFSWFDKVNSKKIVFTNYYGSGYGDNPKYIAEYIIDNNLDYQLYWLVDNTKNLSFPLPEKIQKINYFSFKAMKELSTAGIWIDNCRKSFFPKKKKNQIYIQTWHGSLPIKKIEADASNLPKRYVDFAKNDSRTIDVIVSGSEFKSNIYKTKFWYDGLVLNIGTPRSDIFFNQDKIAFADNKVRKYYGIDSNTRVLLYAPTFRKSHSLEIYNLDYDRILENVKSVYFGNWCIITRLHPNLQKYSGELQLPSYVINGTLYPDMQELLCLSDIVISDYSGLIFDFYLMNKPVFLYCPDLIEYKSEDRDLYFDIDKLPFPIAINLNELIFNIANFSNDQYQNDIDLFKRKIGLYEKGNSCESLFDWVLNENESKTGMSFQYSSGQ